MELQAALHTRRLRVSRQSRTLNPGVFRVKTCYRDILRNRKRRSERRGDPKRAWSDQSASMLTCRNIRYEMADKSRAVNCGGLGAIHLMVSKLGLAREIDERVPLLKRHLPYHESDHVLNLAYNALLDGVRLEDIQLRRNDEAFLGGLGAQRAPRIPDPDYRGGFHPPLRCRFHRGV